MMTHSGPWTFETATQTLSFRWFNDTIAVRCVGRDANVIVGFSGKRAARLVPAT